MSTLPTALRRQLEQTIKQARTVAESGGRKALETLAVHEPDPYRHMGESQRDLRRKLRAQAKQLGDGESHSRRGAYEIKHLVEKLAYDQWHRLLFARFLVENNLLISPGHGVSVTLDDCEELAPSLGLKDTWAVAARFAANELPEIFRDDDPAGAVELAVEDRKPLIQFVTGLPIEVFTASDSLGWCYQFWQAEKKDEVNAAGNKIGADELPAVTQLFTEDYMVDFLLDNTLGAWHAGKVLAGTPKLVENAQDEEELRQAIALPGCPWKYLRFTRGKDGQWHPAAGAFDGWPKTANELKCLDPCMGSGHFVVAMFERLVALRLAEERLDEAAAVTAVIRDNLFGLEIDPRCTQIGAFNLALAAWRRVGHCNLPAMNLACSGLAPNATKEDWLKLAGDDDRFQRGMARLYSLFKDAPVLGSLINPRLSAEDMMVADYHELQPLLEKALAQENKDDAANELAVTARGLAKAADILAGQFTLVATNVPYIGRGKQDEPLQDYCGRIYPEAKADLATCFVERCVGFCASGCSATLVTPQNWLFLGTYKDMRRHLLRLSSLGCVARLGSGAFETIGGEVVNVALATISARPPLEDQTVLGIEVSEGQTPSDKASRLLHGAMTFVSQKGLLSNPDSAITFELIDAGKLLGKHAECFQGISTGDTPRICLNFWEQKNLGARWKPFQSPPSGGTPFTGREYIADWQTLDAGFPSAAIRGREAWLKPGVAIGQMTNLPAALYDGSLFSNSTPVIVPHKQSTLPAIWAFCSSSDFYVAMRKLNPKLSVDNGYVGKVPFDLAHWQKVAAEEYPRGLPKPFSSDPTQWLFNGHPAGADQPLQVAVARLLDYQWPRQTGSTFTDCPALGPDGLKEKSDGDGIVCLSAVKGERPADERLRELFATSWGKDWNAAVLEDKLAGVGCAGRTLDDWLRNEFFEQHCALFHNRPFIWHVWDGNKSGFSALVNYHLLDRANLEKLTYAYLGDWLRRQQAAVAAGEAGSDARLEAAKRLQDRLKLILEGEPPYDLFVRWKPLSKQAVGWNPDINDGVRMNIRPFLAQDIPGGKKGAGILRARPNIKWDKDRGKEPVRDKKDFPWFWGWDEEKQDFAGLGQTPDGNRWNDCHYTNAFKQAAKKSK